MEQQRPRHPRPATAPEPEPLPPIPDGGLARAMPAWLRDGDSGPPASPPATAADPAGFIAEDDLPPWLRHLPRDGPLPAPRPDAALAAPPPVAAPPAHPGHRPEPQPRAVRQTPAPVQTPSPSLPHPTARQPAAPGVRPATEPRSRDRRALVAVVGFVLLGLGVLAYLYAQGAL